MRRCQVAPSTCVCVETLEPRLLLSVGVVVTEFMASNGGSWLDGDGRSPDWIEIHNPTNAPVSLDGWFLTDDSGDLDKWPFPPGVTLAEAGDPGGGDYLVVFASNQDVDDYVDAGGNLHTNFKLSRNDGNEDNDVLLVRPGAERIEHGYVDYPPQFTDVSYGVFLGTTWNTLVGPAAPLSYHVPTAGDAGLVPAGGDAGWTATTFDDSAWTDSMVFGAAGVIITEVFTGATRFVEIQNVSGQPVDTTGWRVLVNDASGGNVNALVSEAWSLPSGEVQPAAVLYATDDPTDAVADHRWSAPIAWPVDGGGWAMVIDAGGTVMDLAAWGYDAAAIASLGFSYEVAPGVFVDIAAGDQWTGDGADAGVGGTGGVPGGGGLISYTGGTYAENFDSMGTGGAAAPVGWTAGKYGTTQNRQPPGSAPNSESLYIDDGSSTSKSRSYNFGSSGQGDRALGHLPTTSTGDRAVQVAITNNTGSDITEFTLEYTGEQWRDWDADATRPPQVLTLWYSTQRGSRFTYMGVEFDFTGPQQNRANSSLDGNAPANRDTINATFTPTTPIPNGQTFYITWHDQNDDGVSDNPLAVDDFSFTAVFGPREDLARSGDIDTNTAVDFARSNDATKGAPNPGLVVPFGEVVSTVTGIGFGGGGAFNDLIRTDAGRMHGVNASLWTRIEFQAGDLSAVETLTLSMKYDDGFTAYLNGVKVAERNAPPAPAWDSAATAFHPNEQAVVYEDIDISAHRGLLVVGDNVLAIHGLNFGAADGDLLIQPRLVGGGEASAPRYFGNPTPGGENDPDLGAPLADVTFSRPSGTFTDSSIAVELASESPDAVIHYTINGAVPTESSPVYVAPITVTATTQVRARSYEEGKLPSLIASETYVKMHASLASVTSDLPVIIIDTFSGGSLPSNSFENCFIGVFDVQAGGWTDLTAAMDLATRAGIKTRGSSTSGQSFAFEAWDEANDDKDIGLLGMPAESDWILYSSSFDKTKMNNSFIFEVSNQVGQYAVRTRFVDVYMNTGDGQVTSSDHRGVYVLMEKIKQGPDRVDVEDLDPADNAEPEITGGYMLKIDRPDPGDSGFHTSRGTPTMYGYLNYVYPKEVELTSVQKTWIRNWLEEFEGALYGPNFTDPDVGYAAYIDVDAFIEHHALNELAKNPDAHWLSTYMYLPREGKLGMGPIWDFDRALGFENRSVNPVGHVQFNGVQLCYHYDWWGRLFQDPDFMQRYIDRLAELRKGPMSIANLHAIVDAQAAELQNSQSGNGSWWGYVNNLRNWLTNRVVWIDSNFRRAPGFNVDNGQVAPGTAVRLSTSEGSIYYTTDGTDPRAPGGGISPAATRYTGSPIVINGNTKITARVLASAGKEPHTEWSAPANGVFVLQTPADANNVAITEINYNPPPPTPAELAVDATFTGEDFEYVELRNVGAETVALGGVKFVDGIEFEFPVSSVLAPGGRIVAAANRAAFEARYGTGLPLAGQYGAGADAMGLSNTGEVLALDSVLGAPIAAFRFNDSGSWPGRADGKGATLVVIDTAGDYDDPDNWRSSAAYGGTPGAAPQAEVGVVINEVLTHTDEPDRDTVELHNTTGADVNIGGWYLSDSWGWDATGVAGNYKKFRIPDGTVIPAGQYVTFDEDDFNPTLGADPRDFALSGAHGDDVWLMKADPTGALTHFADHVDFLAAANGESLGRWPNATGDLYPMVSTTLGGDNTASGPQIGPVVVTEIMYHPADPDGPGGIDLGDLEFIELFNPTGEAIVLAQWLANPHVTGQQYFSDWRLRGGVDMEFDQGVAIGAGGTLVVLSFDPDTPANASRVAAFRTHYGIAPGAPLVLAGGFGGWLDDDGATVRLQRPDSPPRDEVGFVPHLLEDEVRYEAASPWPAAAGSGQSIHRQGVGLWGSDPASWAADDPTPGSVDFPDTTAPAVSALGVDSTAGSMGTVDSSLWTTDRSAQTVPWSIVDRLVVMFDEPVIAVAGDLLLHGVNSGVLAPSAVAGSGTTTVTWTLTPAGLYVGTDRYTVVLGVGVTDVSGNPLADEWTADLHVVLGDINGDGRVSSRDRRVLRDAYGSAGGDANYTPLADLNADGRISSRDRRILRDGYGTALPEAPPLPAAAALGSLDEMDSGDLSAARPVERPGVVDVAAVSTAMALDAVREPQVEPSPDAMPPAAQTVSVEAPSTGPAGLPVAPKALASSAPPENPAPAIVTDVSLAPTAAQLEPDLDTDLANILPGPLA